MRFDAMLALSALCALGCAGPSATPSATPTDPAAERAAVERAITTWFDSGVGTGDTARIRRGLTPTAAILEDSVWFDPAGFVEFVHTTVPRMVGGPSTIKYSLSDWRTTVQGDVAWTSLRNRAVLTPTQGPPMPLDWRETAVLSKVGGAWLIDRYHSASVR
jgi:ketosteroid isomerase-like protein